jgi:large subunit ribosomal protein L30
MRTIRVRLTRSPIGSKPNQRKTVVALGLRRLSSSVIVEETPAIAGMVRTVSHLVQVEEVEGAVPAPKPRPRARAKAGSAKGTARKSAAKKPAAKKPAAQKPAAKKPAAQKPAAQKPAAQKPAAKKPEE